MKLISLARFFLVIFFSFASLLAQAENTHVLIKTNQGDIVIELENDKAPISVDNFLTYVQDKHYDGTIFHRVIKNFMIQGGGMDENREELIKRFIDNGYTVELIDFQTFAAYYDC